MKMVVYVKTGDKSVGVVYKVNNTDPRLPAQSSVGLHMREWLYQTESVYFLWIDAYYSSEKKNKCEPRSGSELPLHHSLY